MECVIAIPQTGPGLFRKYMKSKYVSSLRRAGAKVRWIELEDVDEAVRLALECDGLLLAGGDDVDPHRYGQEISPLCGKVNHLRDEGEWAILEAFLPLNKPILCVCRGMQLLNVFTGGTLHQDIAAIRQCSHSDWYTTKRGIHTVQIQPDTRLAQLIQREQVKVNSLHHQAADQVGKDLTVSAVSQDGLVEAIELREHPFCMGVQWHPEHMSSTNPCQQRIFDAFVQACQTK